MTDTRKYPIPPAMTIKDDGGLALAAIAGGKVVDIRYLSQEDPDLEEGLSEGGLTYEVALRLWWESAVGRLIVERLQAQGDIRAGVCEKGNFEVL